VLMKRKTIALTLIVTILVLTIIAVLFVEKPSPSSFDNPDQNSLFIASFHPILYGNIIRGGNITLVNPTNRYFDNLQLTAKVDDLNITITYLRETITCNAYDVRNESIQVTLPHNLTEISIEPYQNKSIQFNFADSDITVFSPHEVKLYILHNTLGDIIDGQSFMIPQKKAYIQIIGYSSIEHSNNTWNEYYNSTTNRHEFRCDQPNFCQEYYGWHSRTLDSSSYYWAKSFNQLYEHYFNVTVFNNNTFPVESITLFGGYAPDGGGWVVSALSTKILQPNETYVFPVPLTLTGGETTVDNVNQLSTFFEAYTYASGDLINNHK
jgi:hypothetical protein